MSYFYHEYCKEGVCYMRYNTTRACITIWLRHANAQLTLFIYPTDITQWNFKIRVILQIIKDTQLSLSDAGIATQDRPSWRSLVRDATCPAMQAT